MRLIILECFIDFKIVLNQLARFSHLTHDLGLSARYVDVDGTHVALCYCYGLKAMGGQMVWTSFTDIIDKVKGGESIVKILRERLRQTGFFRETQKEMKFNFQQKLTDTQINGLTDILVDLANSIESSGLL